MKYVTNTSSKSFIYKGKEIKPGESYILNDDGSFVDSIADNGAAIAELKEEMKSNQEALLSCVETKVTSIEKAIEETNNQLTNTKKSAITLDDVESRIDCRFLSNTSVTIPAFTKAMTACTLGAYGIDFSCAGCCFKVLSDNELGLTCGCYYRNSCLIDKLKLDCAIPIEESGNLEVIIHHTCDKDPIVFCAGGVAGCYSFGSVDVGIKLFEAKGKTSCTVYYPTAHTEPSLVYTSTFAKQCCACSARKCTTTNTYYKATIPVKAGNILCLYGYKAFYGDITVKYNK